VDFKLSTKHDTVSQSIFALEIVIVLEVPVVEG
jgi:hypothetical protein